MSSFTTSINLLFGLPLGLLPGSSNLSILLPICSLSLHNDNLLESLENKILSWLSKYPKSFILIGGDF
ncbi:hypothetical protein LDENG_00134200, partial [Lucifuga dentata]